METITRVILIKGNISEDNARKLDVCLGCGKPKDLGLVVCWDCFKYREDIKPLKYFVGSLTEWLKQLD